jgi:hypothetical protein
MTDLFNIKSPNFLGGQNVHSLAIIALGIALVIKTKAYKK